MTAQPDILGSVSRAEIEIIESSIDAWNRGDIDAALGHYSDEPEWVAAEENPDAGTLRGRDEIRAYLENWRSTLSGLRYEVKEYLDGGDCAVSLGVAGGRLGADGPVLKVELCLVVRFEDGVPVRVEEYLHADRARAAAGLPAA